MKTMSEEYKAMLQNAKDKFEYARTHGICVRCGAKFPPNGRTLCPDCRRKMDYILAKTSEGR